MTTRVLVLGAGFGGLELSTRLSEELGDQADVTLIDKRDAFVFGFAKLDVMFGRSTSDEVRLRYADHSRAGVRFRQETITAIDPVARTATTEAGTYEADVLVVALGADYDVAATPGLAELGSEFYSVDGAFRLRETLAGFDGGDVVIGVCGNGFKCPPAPNETAFLLHDLLVERGVRDRSTISVVVPMPVPLPPVPPLSEAILSRYAERGITWHGGPRVTELVARDERNVAVLSDGSHLPFDLFLGVPVHKAPDVVLESGLTVDGWIPVDRSTAATRFPGVYAVGDVTSIGTAKAGVFAERTARVVADQLLARIRGEEEPPGYDGTGECYVELGQQRLGNVHVDFFGGEHPTGWFTDEGEEGAAGKREFGRSRHQRWFGLDV